MDGGTIAVTITPAGLQLPAERVTVRLAPLRCARTASADRGLQHGKIAAHVGLWQGDIIDSIRGLVPWCSALRLRPGMERPCERYVRASLCCSTCRAQKAAWF